MKQNLLKQFLTYIILFLCVGLFVGLIFEATQTIMYARADSNSLNQQERSVLDMSESEYIDFLIANGIQIPDSVNDDIDFRYYIENIIQASHRSSRSSYLAQDIVDEIQALVDDYQAIVAEQKSFSDTNKNTLENNLVWYNGQWSSTGGDWDDNYLNYNCYSFAIGKTDERYRYPGQHSGVEWIGYMKTYSVSQMAEFVKDDLIALGDYENVSVFNFEPIIQPWQTLICIRRGIFDYHFMKYDPVSGYWEHKPGPTAPLRYLYHPEDMIWVSEYSEYGVSYSVKDQLDNNEIPIVYDSDIYYITYERSPFETTISGNTCTITGVKQGITLSGSLTIPESINEKTVTQIGSTAFCNCTSLTSVIIPANITSIGPNAFKNCTNLESVTFDPDISLTAISNQAFYGCSKLERIDLPASVTSIGAQAFYGCSNLKKLIIFNNSGVVNLGSGALAETSNKLIIYVPEELYSTYTTATNWTGYTAALDKWYWGGTHPYILEPTIFQGDRAFTILWIYGPNYDLPIDRYGDENGAVGAGFCTYCYIRFDVLSYIYEFEVPPENNFFMWIWLGEDANGLAFNIYDYQMQYAFTETVENGALFIYLNDFLEWGYCRLYIEAYNANDELILFDISDIEVSLILINYL